MNSAHDPSNPGLFGCRAVAPGFLYEAFVAGVDEQRVAGGDSHALRFRDSRKLVASQSEKSRVMKRPAPDGDGRAHAVHAGGFGKERTDRGVELRDWRGGRDTPGG
jgi:hypothetical protein